MLNLRNELLGKAAELMLVKHKIVNQIVKEAKPCMYESGLVCGFGQLSSKGIYLAKLSKPVAGADGYKYTHITQGGEVMDGLESQLIAHLEVSVIARLLKNVDRWGFEEVIK